jgi:KUP system potassium uptake protein
MNGSTEGSSLRSGFGGVIKSLGIVFGDIGTSPIYALYAIFCVIPPVFSNVIGIVSLVIWTLIAIVTVQYAWLAMSLSKKGEGGTIVLREILKSLLTSKTKVLVITLMSFVGLSLFIGDGVITPAISILSAVEGIRLIPGCATLSTNISVAVAAMIAYFLFLFQRRGVERVSVLFGPIMAVWFLVLAISGFVSILEAPIIFKALNPYYGIQCFLSNKVSGLFILSGVILCATGGEALYADMGHLGCRPIRQAWVYVCIALILNYMGQGAFLLTHPQANLVFHEMLYSQASMLLYIPLLILCVIASIIASQAMISGVFSVVYQGIMTGIMPRFKVDYTSTRLHAQVYIGIVNWVLFAAVFFVMIKFRESAHLAAAYGFAVSGTMVITGSFIALIFYLRKYIVKTVLAVVLVLLNILFFCASMVKLQQGGYWSLVIALVPLSIILIYYFGQKKMRGLLKSMPLRQFLMLYKDLYAKVDKIEGTGLFFVRATTSIPSYVAQTMLDNGIMYTDNILVSIIQRDNPFGVLGFFKEQLADGLRVFEIHCGYMEVPNIEKILVDSGIEAKAIFFGIDEIVTKKLLWRIFAIIKHLSPTFVRFHRLPTNKIHGVVTLIKM